MNKNNCPLAIVGMSCLFPKADGLQAYWANIKNGVDAITPIPAGSHWNAADYFNADPKAPPSPFFTIWRKVAGGWKYVAE